MVKSIRGKCKNADLKVAVQHQFATFCMACLQGYYFGQL